MSTKTALLDTPKLMVIKALDKTKQAVTTANDYTLHVTEDILTEGIVLAEQWQSVGNKAVKSGLALAAIQQDLVFDALTGVKKHAILSKKRLFKLFA